MDREQRKLAAVEVSAATDHGGVYHLWRATQVHRKGLTDKELRYAAKIYEDFQKLNKRIEKLRDRLGYEEYRRDDGSKGHSRF